MPTETDKKAKNACRQLLAENYFWEKAPSRMFDWVLNTPMLSGVNSRKTRYGNVLTLIQAKKVFDDKILFSCWEDLGKFTFTKIY